MLTDTHCHPFDLAARFLEAEQERRRLGVLAIASACNMEEFEYNEDLSRKAATEGAALLLPCFAVHAQIVRSGTRTDRLDMLAAEGRLAAVGEFGFDLFNATFRETEAEQDRVFAAHLETALRHDLPVVLHVRRAMHKIFAAAKSLAKCRAVVFHSWPGTLEEGQALLRRGVNAYFSFGNTVLNGRKQTLRCCALLPAERLLTETDAPYQPRRGQHFSHWEDLPLIIEAAAVLRGESAEELEARIEKNFRIIFSV